MPEAKVDPRLGNKEMKASVEQMNAARIPVEFRDYCAHLLLPLNKCRRRHYYMPWHCEHERHSYEVCQYEDYAERAKEMENIRSEGAWKGDNSPRP